jgi:hypothetical protein
MVIYVLNDLLFLSIGLIDIQSKSIIIIFDRQLYWEEEDFLLLYLYYYDCLFQQVENKRLE